MLSALPLAGAAVNADAGEYSPRIDFMLECQGCHRPGGIGMPEINVPTLKGHVSKFLHSADGRAFLLRVPGVAQSALSDERLTAVMNWMVREFDAEHLPADFENFRVDEVTRGRREILRNVSRERGRILEASGFDPGGGYQ